MSTMSTQHALLLWWFELWTQYPGSVVPLAMFLLLLAFLQLHFSHVNSIQRVKLTTTGCNWYVHRFCWGLSGFFSFVVFFLCRFFQISTGFWAGWRGKCYRWNICHFSRAGHLKLQWGSRSGFLFFPGLTSDYFYSSLSFLLSIKGGWFCFAAFCHQRHQQSGKLFHLHQVLPLYLWPLSGGEFHRFGLKFVLPQPWSTPGRIGRRQHWHLLRS